MGGYYDIRNSFKEALQKEGCDQTGCWETGSRKISNKINDGESLSRKRDGQYCQRYLH